LTLDSSSPKQKSFADQKESKEAILRFLSEWVLTLFNTHFGISSFSHPDNALEVCGLLTPLHIVPEWYFLCQYAMLKAVPNKNAGFIILLTSIFTFFFFGEIRNLTTFTRLMDYNNGFSLSSFFLSLLSFLWIGAQFPQEKFLSYGRILTLHYYFLLMCILFSSHSTEKLYLIITNLCLSFGEGTSSESKGAEGVEVYILFAISL